MTKRKTYSILIERSRERVRKSGFERKILKKSKKFLTNRTGHDILTKLLTRVAITKRDRELRKKFEKIEKKYLTNEIECGKLIKLLARASGDCTL